MGCLEELCSCSHRTWIRIRDLLQEIRQRLRGEVQNLENEVLRVEVLAEQARNNVRKFHVVFTTWKESADKALEEAPKLLDDFEKATKTCCYGTLPDPKSRYQFSRKAEGKIEVIKQLTQKCSRFNALNDISFIDPAFTSSASKSIKLGDDGVFESRALMIRNIMGALADDSNSVVGVYGMGGIGKSTLLVDVEGKIREEKSFDWVAKADVSENPDIKTIQGEIADALGLTKIKEKETISGRAKLLHERLKDEEREKKKVLIILDNLWKGLDLNKVGIPCGHDNKVIGCKLLLTSRDRNVLRSEMGCDKDFPLGELEEEEARSLFERWVGDKVHDDKFKPLVDEALHKCFGMPFLIVHMAKVFKLADLPEWKNVLKQIKLSKNEESGK
ncbi:probable disease resistance protein At5g43740 [Eucalyptus grandis]|uniref:probable disease resistance protein At5g43740 n=1 Tax=Eucalyptus grandis TaxID=71139 RepID=UPI00192EF12F|nr:probable disease resistance protein At5g43740 [Eucalyptus grandis]